MKNSRPETLADLIEEGLQRRGLLRKELAKELGVVAVSVSKWLHHREKDPIPWRHWRAITKILDIRWARWYRVAQRERPEHARLYDRFIGRRR